MKLALCVAVYSHGFHDYCLLPLRLTVVLSRLDAKRVVLFLLLFTPCVAQSVVRSWLEMQCQLGAVRECHHTTMARCAAIIRLQLKSDEATQPQQRESCLVKLQNPHNQTRSKKNKNAISGNSNRNLSQSNVHGFQPDNMLCNVDFGA